MQKGGFAMNPFRVLFVLLLVTALLVACTPATDPIQTTATEPTTVTTLPIANTLVPPKQHKASVFRFLQDTNHNGTIAPYTELVPPGTLPEMAQIPQPDQELIGQTVDILLSMDQQMTPFFYVCTGSGTEYLYVIVPAKIPMLILFETQLGGVNKLYPCLRYKKVFQGKIAAMVNISHEEGNIYAYNVCADQKDVFFDEILTDAGNIATGQYLGVVGNRETGAGWEQEFLMKGTYVDNVSVGLFEDIRWMYRLLQRYGLSTLYS